MSRAERITCDQCGAVKKETNHWYTAAVTGHRKFVICLSADLLTEPNYQDICGHQCAIAALNQFLQTGTLNREVQSIEEKA